jgi:LPXTG-motif cell wall-anchored protein
VEQVATTLPNTGPSSSMMVSVLAVMIIGYFFFRSRLLTKELEIVHHEYSAGGL